MNYIIEGGGDIIDFYAELKSEIAYSSYYDNAANNNKECLITKQPLTYNHVTLPCGHKFNYFPLYTEICLQKQRNYSTLEIVKLDTHQIKCPYCRTIFNELIPYIPMNGVSKTPFVNYPLKYCMFIYKCRSHLKSGINKGLCCDKHAYESATEEGIFCEKHWKQEHEKKEKSNTLASAKDNNEIVSQQIWTEEMEEMSKCKSVIDLKKMLRSKGLKITGTKKELIFRIFLDMTFS